MSEVINNIPIISLRGVTIFPYMVIHFDARKINEIEAVEQAMVSGQTLFICDCEYSELDKIAENGPIVGSVVEIKQILRLPKSNIQVTARGKARARLVEVKRNSRGTFAGLELIETDKNEYDEITQSAYSGILKDELRFIAGDGRRLGEILNRIKAAEDVEEVIYRIAADIISDQKAKKTVLESNDLSVQFNAVLEAIHKEEKIMGARAEIEASARRKIETVQKEHILREQMKVIREALGEAEEAEADEFRNRLLKLNASDEVKEKIGKEIKRFLNISGSSSEGNVVRTYIEELLDMPWNNESTDNNDLKNAAKILDDDHYGLEKVKDRILEFLAVRIYAKATDKGASVICLVGPPGTGKTSIVQSIAKALNREYVRICLGGVRDEAEIRGHRKTYVGAMPGKIAYAIKQAKVCNPVILLDEIDKTGTDSRGDTASALLEVLDTAQNNRFMDHYLEVPLDLSKVLFVCTANDSGSIPRALYDRMDVIELTSYTENEKFHIAKDYLVKKAMASTGLTKADISFADSALYTVIRNYTREAGVRNLERRLQEICRKVVKNKLIGELEDKAKITSKNVKDYLGKEKIKQDKAPSKATIGTVTGLAWTSVGGDTLSIEVAVMPGKGEMILTGNLGDVMKESARIALSYVRSIAKKYKVSDEFFEKNNLHIHIPEGAVPKDGPSAGITLSTAILSAVAKLSVQPKLAMTGEVTLRGEVLPIGGLKEKLLAAGNYGITTVIVPDKNRPDVAEISEEITGKLDIHYVTNMSEVIELALIK